MSTHDHAAELRRMPRRRVGTATHRALDLTVAFAALLFFMPLMLFIALAIWVESGSPIFFAQIRLGQRGEHFRLYKFRKFHEKGTTKGRALTVANDCRLTRIGKFLAQTKLDELPQLWNVLNGDMSLVGPRPESLNFADCFDDRYRKVLDYKPGIFGPNQVFFRNEGALYEPSGDPEQFYRDVLFPLKARVDLAYFAQRNFLFDIAWILRGVFAVLGWSFLPHIGGNAVEQVEAWLRQGRGRNFAPSFVKARN
jgi:lipopolysaccharide/colanic/teichoic acid biosynthesis glycosyltransferase